MGEANGPAEADVISRYDTLNRNFMEAAADGIAGLLAASGNGGPSGNED
jgi:hypothetical protein